MFIIIVSNEHKSVPQLLVWIYGKWPTQLPLLSHPLRIQLMYDWCTRTRFEPRNHQKDNRDGWGGKVLKHSLIRKIRRQWLIIWLATISNLYITPKDKDYVADVRHVPPVRSFLWPQWVFELEGVLEQTGSYWGLETGSNLSVVVTW